MHPPKTWLLKAATPECCVWCRLQWLESGQGARRQDTFSANDFSSDSVHPKGPVLNSLPLLPYGHSAPPPIWVGYRGSQVPERREPAWCLLRASWWMNLITDIILTSLSLFENISMVQTNKNKVLHTIVLFIVLFIKIKKKGLSLDVVD